MNTIHVDADLDDHARRRAVYDGALFLYSPRPSTLAFVAHAREMIEDAFGGLDPETAQHSMDVEDYAALLADLKPRFIHHPRSKECIHDVLVDLGADPEQTYFDVPRMRTSTSDDYLTSGIAYAFHAHRDTWYSAPQMQLNWWIPIYTVTEENVMAFHLEHWEHGVRNGSREYNYAEWNRTSRQEAAKHVRSDTRKQPKALGPVKFDPQIRPVVPAGGVILFSGAQLHSSVPNTSGRTRFSIDFRTVNVDDVEAGIGAPNIDSECTGTSLGDFLRVTDRSTHLSAELIERYDTPPHPEAAISA
jgi:hypothetical protein